MRPAGAAVSVDRERRHRRAVEHREEVTGMKKIAVRKTDSIKLTTIVIGPGYAAC